MSHPLTHVLPLALFFAGCGEPAAPAAPAVEPAAPAVEPALASGPTLGALQDLDPIMGCSCTVSSTDGAEAIWFGSPLGEEEAAWIHLDGADRRVSATGAPAAAVEGEKATDTYAGEGYTVTVAWGVGQPCEPAEECEATLYSATITVARDGATPLVAEGQGSCGC